MFEIMVLIDVFALVMLLGYAPRNCALNSWNYAVGRNAMQALSTGSRNVCLGPYTDVSDPDGNDQVNIFGFRMRGYLIAMFFRGILECLPLWTLKLIANIGVPKTERI